jgi:hypothetical protein
MIAQTSSYDRMFAQSISLDVRNRGGKAALKEKLFRLGARKPWGSIEPQKTNAELASTARKIGREEE